MHDFEEELKGRFKDAASTEGVDADQLWAGIAAGLPETPAPAPKKKRYRWLWLSLLSLTPLFWLLLTPHNEEQALPATTEEMNGIVSSLPPNSSSTQLTPSPLETTTSPSNTEPTQTEKIITPRKADIEAPVQRKGEQSAKYDEQPTLTEDSSLESSGSNGYTTQPSVLSTPTKFIVEPPVVINESAVPKVGAEKAQLDQPSLNTIDVVSETRLGTADQLAAERELLPLALLERKSAMLPAMSVTLEFVDPLPQVDKATPKRFHFGAFTGLQFWSDAYAQQGSLGRTLKEAHSSQAGYSVSVEVGYQLRPNLEIRSGMEYVQSYTQFNGVQTWDTVMFRPNVPDTEIIDALATRTVKHQNQQQLLAIPIMLGTTLKRGRFSLGVNAGLGLNFLLKQSGKSLNSQEVITSYGSNGAAEKPYTNFFWSAQLQPYAQYQLTEGMAVQFRPSLRWQVHGNSTFYDLRHQSFLSGLSVGLLF